MKVGIFRGTFDPIHKGHLCLAQIVLDRELCDKVIFFPEKSPRFKTHVTNFRQRCEMIESAIDGSSAFELIVDEQELQPSVDSVFSSILREFGEGNEYVSIMGADVFASLCCWPDAHKLINRSSFAVASRSKHDLANIHKTLKQIPGINAVIINTKYKHISSSKIRQTLLNSGKPQGVPSKIRGYIKTQGLYGHKSL